MIAVFGATGNVGGKVAGMLLGEGIPIRVLARTEENARPLSHAGAEVVIGDLRNVDSIKETLERCNGAFLMTPLEYKTDRYIEDEIQIGRNYEKALRDSSIAHVAYLSVWKSRESTGIPFFESKAIIEDELIASGVDCTFLRPASFMENIYQQIQPIKESSTVSMPMPGNVPMPIVATEDVAYVAAQSLMHPKGQRLSEYNVLGSRDYTLEEETSIISKAIGKPLTYTEMPEDQARQIFASMGTSKRAIDDMMTFFRTLPTLKVEGDRNHVYNDFNFEPTTLESFIEVTMANVLVASK